LAGPSARVVIVCRASQDDERFARRLEQLLARQGGQVVAMLRGDPAEVRRRLQALAGEAAKVDVLATTRECANWTFVERAAEVFPALGAVRVMTPPRYVWPTFLKTDNLLNVANQIVVIAVMAVGMTMVIITGGIDLSVGSLVALSAVVAAWLIRAGGGEAASGSTLAGACVAAVLVCGAVGAFSSLVITVFGVPPFIATLSMMQVASGLAFLIAQGQSIHQIPDSFVWLGRGADLMGVPNGVVLMVLLYAGAYVLMSRTTLGRYLYAVGGNAESARLSGIRTRGVLTVAYVTSAMMAGLGGVVTASQLKSGSPTYGQMYELYVIAAVVVGGTSLAGGEGKILGTLIGALIIAVIWNGMNLTGVESYTQKVVLGLVILGAVLLDMLKKRSWRGVFRSWLRRPPAAE
jgi:ribose transport system permease protein